MHTQKHQSAKGNNTWRLDLKPSTRNPWVGSAVPRAVFSDRYRARP